MSEEKKGAKPEEKAKKPKGEKAAGGEKTPGSDNHAGGKREEKKKKWTKERCFKIARRFSSEEAWAAGSPSCYKSAVAHGWTKECLGHMQQAPKKLRKSA